MHEVFHEAKRARAHFKIVAADQLPPGRACRITEEEGSITVAIRRGDGTDDLCAQLVEYHGPLLGQCRWVQTLPASTKRIELPPQGLAIARASWQHIARHKLPSGAVCLPHERPGDFTWLLHEDHASDQLCTEMNRYLTRIVGDGLWLQRWTTAA